MRVGLGGIEVARHFGEADTLRGLVFCISICTHHTRHTHHARHPTERSIPGTSRS